MFAAPSVTVPAPAVVRPPPLVTLIGVLMVKALPEVTVITPSPLPKASELKPLPITSAVLVEATAPLLMVRAPRR